MISSVAIIGIGNIGGSMALGLRECCDTLHGFDNDAAALNWTHTEGLIDVAHSCASDAARAAELVVLATPPGAMADVCQELMPHVSTPQTVTDVGSTKTPVLEAIRETCGEVPPWFVPGHPIAGTEKTGARHASGELFRGRCAVLTPLENTDSQCITRVQWMWEQLGMVTQQMDAEAHDAMVAGVSHLPHVLAFALMDMLAQKFTAEDLKRYAAGGLLDFTRIASSNPELWADICRDNQEQLVPILELFQMHLSALIAALREEQTEALQKTFSAARDAREQLRGDE